MTRKSQSTQRGRSGKQSGSGRSRSEAGSQSRQSASGQRQSSQSEGSRSRSGGSQSRERGGRREQDHQDWSFSQPPGERGESRRGDERQFASQDYDRPGRGHPAYAAQGGSGRGFASMDPERRREIAARGGRASHGRPSEEQSERRFTRELDSYYGRPREPQEFADPGNFREERRFSDDRFQGGSSFRGQEPYRPPHRESDRGDWRTSHPEDDYPTSRSGWRGDSGYEEDDRRSYAQARQEGYSSSERDRGEYPESGYRREEGYEDRESDYQRSSRGGPRYSEEDDDRFYAGRGPRDRESTSAGQRRQSESRGGRQSSGRRRQ